MKIGILTSGGDCPGINDTIRGVCKTAINHYGMEVYGIHSGFRGLLDNDVEPLTERSLSGLLNLGGTILGTSREKPFKKRLSAASEDKPALMLKNIHDLGLDCIVCIGGNGTQKTAAKLAQAGVNVVSVPKTIDNDVWGTDVSFGFDSAVTIATDAIDRLHSTASSHQRVMVIEVMGHKVGHICLSAGIASGADVILLPEIPYDIKEVAKAIKTREKNGKKFSIIACAEGALSKEEATLSKKEYKAKVKARNGQSVVYEIAAELEKYIDSEIRVSCIGHAQRGGQPCPYDRMISTQFGVAGARLVMGGDYGKLVILKNNGVTAIPLVESAGKLKYVDAVGAKVKDAKLLGISFGD